MDTIHAEKATSDSLAVIGIQDKLHAAKATLDSPIYGIDFGTDNALAIHGPDGHFPKSRLKLPKIKGGRTRAMQFPMVLNALFSGGDDYPAGDAVVESATIGASGCEVQDVLDLLSLHPDRKLYTISCRAVKNFRADNALGWSKGARYAKDGDPTPVYIPIDKQEAVHTEDAEIIYRIATEQPYRLYHWTAPSEGPERVYTSVRPMDKRGYRDVMSQRFMSLLPPFETLPQDLQKLMYSKKEGGYARSFIMPFAMASEEPYLDMGPATERKRRYEKIIGLYDRGYPSFYRRATINWMQANAKLLAEVTRIGDVPPQVRKEAWKLTQRQIRQFFHLTMAHQGR